MILSLTECFPQVTGEEMAAALTPPPHFAAVSLESYIPDPRFPSQHEAVDAVRDFVTGIASSPSRTGLFGRRRKQRQGRGLYLDGGFGVGKTHLLAAAWHAFDGTKVFGTFIEFTSIVGALGYSAAAARFAGIGLVCIDEFELDDPGDTLIMSRLLSELSSSGTSIIATSNTPPNALGEGRFAAKDFAREIHGLATIFDMVRIDGTDYRVRHTASFHRSMTDEQFAAAVTARSESGLRVAVDDFDRALAHLSQLHPVRYERLAGLVDVVAWRAVRQIESHNEGLRLVAFVDRLYDAGRSVIISGITVGDIFSAEILASGYAKKYQRTLSRLAALIIEEQAS